MLKFNKLAVLAMLVSTLTLSVKAEDIFGLTTDGKIVRFDSSAPGTIISSVTVTGLQTGETIVGMDFRPGDGKLYAVGSTSRIYTLNVVTGVATQIGTSAFTPALNGTIFGVDFNPAADRIRIVSNTGQNLRLNPNDGTVAFTDTNLAYFDANSASAPNVVGAAYTNNFSGAAGTTLFDVDSNLDVLAVQSPPDNGGLLTVGKLGVDISDQVGFDVSAFTGTVYLTSTSGTTTKLYEVSLATGSAIELGTVGGTVGLADIAIPTGPTTIVFGLTTTNQLFRFNTAAPNRQIGTTTAITVGGNAITGTVVGIDFRPANGLLYALTSNGNDCSLYSVDSATGAATKVGSNFEIPNSPNGTEYGFDFNPVPDRIRLVTSTGTNLRLNPDTGAIAAFDGNLAFAAGDANAGTPQAVAAAYINNFAGTTTTTLYGIDTGANVLYLQNPPNAGTCATVGTSLGVSFGTQVGFDITSDNRAFASDGSNFYAVGLSTGRVALIGTVGATIRDIAIATAPTTGTGGTGAGRIAFTADSYQVVEGQVAQITLTRTNGSSGLVSVFLTTSTTNGNTATSGVDFTPIAQTVTFADGETSRTVEVEGLTDSTLEVFETAALVLSNPIGASLGTLSTSTLIVVDVDDRDGDGFTTAEELAAGTSDTDASSTPFGGAPAGAADTTNLTISKVALKLNFTKANSDSIAFSANLAAFTVTDLATLSGQKVTINFGGVIKSLTLDTKGKAVSSDKKDSFTIKKPKNNVSGITVKFNKGDFDTALTDEGLGDDPDSPSKAPRTVVIRLLFNGKAYVESVALEAKISAGKGSNAKSVKLR
jgi:hypothetical protein